MKVLLASILSKIKSSDIESLSQAIRSPTDYGSLVLASLLLQFSTDAEVEIDSLNQNWFLAAMMFNPCHAE